MVINGFLSSQDCESLSSFAAAQPHKPLDVYTLDKGADEGYAQSRSSNRVTDRVNLGSRRSEVNELMHDALKGEIATRVGREFSWFEKPQMLRYDPGGYFRKHADSEFRIMGTESWVKQHDRDISILLYLNDDFKGGQLLFHHFNYLYTPVAGDLLFFPSDHRYEHEAKPLISGERYVIVSWAAFRDEPRAQEKQMPENVIID